jgi:hypothetical protein
MKSRHREVAVALFFGAITWLASPIFAQTNRLSTYVYYDGVLGRNNYDNNAVSGGFRIGF